ncbi:MAG: peptide-binding protein [Candidatus Eremiobacteraeota bacterium]|jgi:predicted aspartyl protease|nr:peptide-binding protein [Candidatus Eremiobacteraeota bacterium]
MIYRVISAVLALAMLMPALAAADDGLPDAATITANARKGQDVPLGYRWTTVTVRSNGVTVSEREIVRGDDWRTISTAGPFHEEAGRIKSQGWHQNANGQTVNDEPDPGNAKPDPTTTTVIRTRTPLDAYVVAKLNVRGWGTRRFVDPQTWRTLRFETITANGSIVTDYADFRLDGGRFFAHHWSTRNDYAQTTSETTVTAYDATPVKDEEIAEPASRRSLVTFPPGVTSTELPVKFGRHHVFVRVTINGRGLDFMLDSGAAGITIDNGIAHELGLTLYGPHSSVAAQRYGTARSIIPEMKVGSLVMHDVAVTLAPDTFHEQNDVRTVGLLGFDFLAELGVTIDYEHQRVVAVSEPQYQPPAGKGVIPLDVRIGNGSPYLDVLINGALSERFLIDTGGGGSLMIFDAFARKHPEALKDKGGGGDARRVRFSGIGGTIETQPYQLGSVRIGSLNFVDFVGFLVTAKHSYAGDVDGLIGADFLRLFDVGLDYASSRVYLVPNALGRRAMGIKD